MNTPAGVFTIPNILTFSRLLCAIAFFVLGLMDQWILGFWIFIGGAATDLIDGNLARILNQKTRLGSILDPLVDKTMMGLAIILLVLKSFLPFWLLIVFFFRDLVMIYGLIRFRLRKIKVQFRPIITSKITTLLLIITIGVAILQPLALRNYGPWDIESLTRILPYFIYPTGVLVVVTTIQYYVIGLRIVKRGSD